MIKRKSETRPKNAAKHPVTAALLLLVPAIVILISLGSAPAAFAEIPDFFPVTHVRDGSQYTQLRGAFDITAVEIDSRHYVLVAAYYDGGVQIIDVTNPAKPSPVASISDGGVYTELQGARSIVTAQIGGNHYALVASMRDHGVQIINITDPSRPSPAAAISDGASYPLLKSAAGIDVAQIDGRHYAFVASFNDDGVQVIDVTDPYNPSPVAAVKDDESTALDAAYNIAIAEIGSGHYAFVTSFRDNGVQIIDVTDPSSPQPVAAITDDEYTELRSATGITVTQVGNRHYALIAAQFDDGLQILDVTDPANPVDTAVVRDEWDTELFNAHDVATFSLGPRHYAMVAALSDAGVQVIDITDPSRPSNVAALQYGLPHYNPYDMLKAAAGIVTAEINSEHYAFVAAMSGYGVQVIGISNPFKAGADAEPKSEPELKPANTAPVADAGSNQAVPEGSTIRLDGSASTDPDATDVLTYAWSHDSALAITLDDVAAVNPSFVAPNVAQNASVVFTLTVSDGNATAKDTVTVTIIDSTNSPPVVKAGPDQAVQEGSTVSLDGTTTDADPEDALTYSWSHDSALAITLDDVAAVNPSFVAPNVAQNASVVFTLTVSDGHATVKDTVTVTIMDSTNSPPAVKAGPDQAVQEGSTIRLDGSASTDPDATDVLTYAWSHDSALAITLDDVAAVNPSFVAPNVAQNASVVFTLTVSDGHATVKDTVTVTIMDSTNSHPAVKAGSDQAVQEGSTVSLDGTATDADPEDALTYSWSHDSALAITLDDVAAVNPSFVAPNVAQNASVVFTLTVSDGHATVKDTVTVTIMDSTNSPPAVKAGPDQAVQEGSTIRLDGSASTDPDATDVLTYAWSHDSALAITLDDVAAVNPSFVAPNVAQNASVVFTLTVSDGHATVKDTVTVTIMDSTNSHPAVKAGPDQAVQEGSTVSLDGTATDADPEDNLTYSWSHDSALAITLDDVAAVNPSFVAPNVAQNASVVFTLTVSDGHATVKDTVTVTIMDSTNSHPAVKAGPDQAVQEGSTVSLDGTATDADPEDNLTYSWSHDSALAITIADPAALDTYFTAPSVSGDASVVFTLTVSDGHATVKDTVTVTIMDSTNSPPAVKAGPDQAVQEGSTVSLDGTATDADPEDNLTYSWSHDSALAITIADPAALDTYFTAPSVSGDASVVFTLTVSDSHATAKDTVTVTIMDSPNSPPVVKAGPDQAVQEGSTVSLDGTATDADPEDNLTYSWSHDSALAITIADPAALDTYFTAPSVSGDASVVFTLTVSDGTLTVTDTVTVTITDSPEPPPPREPEDEPEYDPSTAVARYDEDGSGCIEQDEWEKAVYDYADFKLDNHEIRVLADARC